MMLNDDTIRAMALLADGEAITCTGKPGGWHIKLPNGITVSVQPSSLAKAAGDGSDAEVAWWKGNDTNRMRIRGWQTPEQVAKRVRTLAAKEVA